MDSSGQMFDIRRSSYYEIWRMEQEEIYRHKWYLSEQAGFDVGYDRAKWDWSFRFRSEWIAGLRASGVYR